jgi:hypothetical protein
VACDITAIDALDLQYVRPVPGQELTANRTGLDNGEVNDFDSFER